MWRGEIRRTLTTTSVLNRGTPFIVTRSFCRPSPSTKRLSFKNDIKALRMNAMNRFMCSVLLLEDSFLKWNNYGLIIKLSASFSVARISPTRSKLPHNQFHLTIHCAFYCFNLSNNFVTYTVTIRILLHVHLRSEYCYMYMVNISSRKKDAYEAAETLWVETKFLHYVKSNARKVVVGM